MSMSHLEYLIENLSRPSAYSHEVDDVEIEQTHISVVFLAGRLVYKVKKPVKLPFLDYSTLEKRRQYCRREIQLNRRLAPESIYRQVVPITSDGDNLEIDGQGDIVEWAVEMKRLPADRTFQALLEAKELDTDLIESAAARIAAFHRDAERADPKWAGYEQVSANLLDNFEETTDHVGDVVPKQLFERTKQLTEQHLEASKEQIEARAAQGKSKDCHGDLRLKHIYHLPEQDTHKIPVVDCIEFNDRFRYSDPLADIAFLNMDFHFEQAPHLREVFMEAYFEESDDEPRPNLLSLYTAYRAAVRAKVEGIRSFEGELSNEKREDARQQALAHWLLVQKCLAEPDQRPMILLLGGLPGTGKSTIASRMTDRLNAETIDTDSVRKELAEMQDGGDLDYGEGIYTEAWTKQTYQTCLDRARDLIARGQRVIVEASFRDAAKRRLFWGLARQLRVDTYFVECRADSEEIERRLRDRTDTPSDAGVDVYRKMRDSWESLEYWPAVRHFELDTSGTVEETESDLIGFLKTVGLA